MKLKALRANKTHLTQTTISKRLPSKGDSWPKFGGGASKIITQRFRNGRIKYFKLVARHNELKSRINFQTLPGGTCWPTLGTCRASD